MISEKLAKLGLTLPGAPAAIASYLPYRVHQGIVYVSGQLPVQEGKIMYHGKIGAERTVEEGMDAARLCAMNVLAQLNSVLKSDWTKFICCLKLTGFVNAVDTFTDHPKVMSIPAGLFQDIFGESGLHSRSSIGVASLPLGATVEIEAMFAVSL